MGTKPAKSRSLGPRCAKVRRGLHPAPTGASAIRSSIHAASKVAKVGAAGGPKLLKWGRLRARQGQICYSPTAGGISRKGLRSTKKGLRSAGGPKLLKWGLSGRGSNLLKSDRPLTSILPPGGCAASSGRQVVRIHHPGSRGARSRHGCSCCTTQENKTTLQRTFRRNYTPTLDDGGTDPFNSCDYTWLNRNPVAGLVYHQ
jgi:hypothetical protein